VREFKSIKEEEYMGLFHKEHLFCACCGEEVQKYSIQLSDGNKMCYECDINVRSEFVKKNIRKKDYLEKEENYKINTEQMKELQKIYINFAERKKQFNVDYYEKMLFLYIDQEHEWFMINDNGEQISKMNIQKYDSPIEIFSLDDVEMIKYGISEFNTTASISFRFKNNFLPLNMDKGIFIEKKLFEGSGKYELRINEIINQLKNYFQNVEFTTYEEYDQLVKRNMRLRHYSSIQNDIVTLGLNRDQLNDSINMIAQALPDKCKKMATRYVYLEKELSKIIEVLQNVDNFHSIAEMIDCMNDSYTYLQEMSEIFDKIFLIAAKKSK